MTRLPMTKAAFRVLCTVLLVSVLPGLGGCSKSQGAAGAKPSSAIRTRNVTPTRLDAEATAIAREEAQEGRRVLVYFHAAWCGPCKRVGKAFDRSENRDAFSRWVLLPVDSDQVPSGPTLGIQFQTIPFFVKLDGAGKAVGTLDGEAFGPEPSDEKVDEVFRAFLRT